MTKVGKVGKSGVKSVAAADATATRRESLLDVAVRRKEVLVAKSVVEEVRKRLLRFKGDSKEREREEKEKDEEKARAAAWAWYQHGKGGKESVSTYGPSGRTGHSPGGSPHQFSRFKTEAMKTSSTCGGGRVELTPKDWEFQKERTPSSLFDSYELDIVSKRIDNAFRAEEAACALAPAPSPPKSLPAASPKLPHSSSLRLHFPRNFCRSIADVVTHKEMALAVDVRRRCDCSKIRSISNSGRTLRRRSKAIQVFMHLPECDYHPQLQHLERRHLRDSCKGYHLRHEHEHEHEHEPVLELESHQQHVHYQVKLKDPTQYGNFYSTNLAKCETLAEMPTEKDYPFFSGFKANHSASPKLARSLF